MKINVKRPLNSTNRVKVKVDHKCWTMSEYNNDLEMIKCICGRIDYLDEFIKEQEKLHG